MITSKEIKLDSSTLFASKIQYKDYRDGRVLYILDGSSLSNPDDYSGKPLLTEITLNPNVKNVNVKGPNNTSVSGNKIFIESDVVYEEGGTWRFFEWSTWDDYTITYQLNGIDYRKLVTVKMSISDGKDMFTRGGYTPVSDDRIDFLPAASNKTNGYFVDKLGNGEIATKFCNSKLSIPWSSDEERDEKFRITAKAPEGYTHYIDSCGFAGRIEEGGLDEINAHFEQAIQDGQIREIPEDGIIEMPFMYYPVEKVIVDNLGKEYVIYSINRLFEDADENTHNVIQWIKLDNQGNIDRDSIKKEYIYSRRLDCNLTLPESVHDGPVPSIYNEELAKKYHLDIEFVPMGITDDGSAGEDYYRIRLLDEYGEDVDVRTISEDGIELFFSYPNGITKAKAEKNHFKLNHFKNAAHEIDETLEFEDITYLEDGFVVKLTHFSPFLLG